MATSAFPYISVDVSDDPEYRTEHHCVAADCGEVLMLAEDVVLIKVVLLGKEDGKLTHHLFINATGNYAYQPCFFHNDCWETYDEQLHDLLEEADVQQVVTQYEEVTCKFCNSSICLGEPVALLCPGMLEASKREPNGKPTTVFYSTEWMYMCISCMRTFNEEILELWDHVSYARECPQCTYERNWRTGTVCNHPQ